MQERLASAEELLAASSQRIESLEEDLEKARPGSETGSEVNKDEEVQKVQAELEQAQAKNERFKQAMAKAREKVRRGDREDRHLKLGILCGVPSRGQNSGN